MQVVDATEEIRWYYEETSYHELLGSFRDEERQRMKDLDGWWEWDDADEEAVRNDAKREALRQWVQGHRVAVEGEWVPRSLEYAVARMRAGGGGGGGGRRRGR
jgi:hypothetical protein